MPRNKLFEKQNTSWVELVKCILLDWYVRNRQNVLHIEEVGAYFRADFMGSLTVYMADSIRSLDMCIPMKSFLSNDIVKAFCLHPRKLHCPIQVISNSLYRRLKGIAVQLTVAVFNRSVSF